MRPFSLVPIAALLAAACTTVIPEPMPQSQPSMQALPAVAGMWDARTLNMEGDSVLVTYQIRATDSRSGWTLNFPGREPIEMRVLEVSGDSIVADAGPYASALREGVTVTTRFNMRIQGDRLTGRLTALYEMPEGSVTVPLRIEGTRVR
jgi:hypothetical protein